MFIFFDILYIFIALDICVMILIAAPLCLQVDLWSLYTFLKVCPFYYIAFAVIGKIGIPFTCKTTSSG